MIEFLTVLFNPRIWMQNYKYSAHCDAWCREAIKNPVIEIKDEYYAVFNGKLVWIGNKYYAFEFKDSGVRPSKYILLKMYRLIEQAQFENATMQF
jgi:hypothetical protein